MQPNIAKCTLSVAAALALCAGALPAWADSTSSASSSASTSIGSSSASIEKSSNSSSTKDQVKEGKYTVVAMTAMAQRPDMLRLRLQAIASTPTSAPAPAFGVDATAAGQAPLADSEFYLLLPRQTAARGQLAVGQVVTAAHRPYGVAFAVESAARANQTFFLVLDDAWFRELESHPLGV